MKETIYITNTFKSIGIEQLKKSVTEKIKNLLNTIVKKTI